MIVHDLAESAIVTVSEVFDPARSQLFGDDAETYDRARPGYPAEVIDLVLRGARATGLDVGCGTGRAARSVIPRNVTVLGIEPDARMAAVARRHGVQVLCTRFEDWHPTRYDCVLSGQAWHWIDPDRGADKAAEVLPAGGLWSAFWNCEDDERLTDVLVSAYARFALHLIDERQAVGSDERSLVDRIDRGVRHTGRRSRCRDTTSDGSTNSRSAGSLIGCSMSRGHRLLDARVAERLHDVIRSELGDPNDVGTLDYTTMALTARRS